MLLFMRALLFVETRVRSNCTGANQELQASLAMNQEALGVEQFS
jgi:hypothetical protein